MKTLPPSPIHGPFSALINQVAQVRPLTTMIAPSKLEVSTHGWADPCGDPGEQSFCQFPFRVSPGKTTTGEGWCWMKVAPRKPPSPTVGGRVGVFSSQPAVSTRAITRIVRHVIRYRLARYISTSRSRTHQGFCPKDQERQ